MEGVGSTFCELCEMHFFFVMDSVSLVLFVVCVIV